MIQAKNLTKYYGDFLAVDDISFEVWDGEILGFLGPNGAGKSTTIKMMTCFMPATAGEVSVAGRVSFHEGSEPAIRTGFPAVAPPTGPKARNHGESIAPATGGREPGSTPGNHPSGNFFLRSIDA